MLTLKRTARRGIAAGVAGLLAASTAAVLAAPAQAAPATGALTWNISEQYVSSFDTRTLSGGVTFDATDKNFTFPATDVTEDADGTVTSNFNGSVRGAFVLGGTEYYSVTVANPVVEVEADGSGEVRATVSAANAAAQNNAAAQTEPTLVTVAEFSGATTTGGTTTVTPDWEGVLPAGSDEATALGITTVGHPVDGKSFHPEFLGAITSGVRPRFYATSSSNTAKRPGDLTFTTAVDTRPTVVTSVVDAGPKKGLTVRAQGTNFDAESHPGAKGVYAVLAPTSTIIDYDDWASVETLAAAAWIGRPGDIGATDTMVNGAFDIRLNAATEDLLIGEEYSVFTWAAHDRGDNASQDTKTPVAIDWSALKGPAKKIRTTTKITQTKHAKKAAKFKQIRVKARVNNPQPGKTKGKVRIVIKQGKKNVHVVKNVKLNKKGVVNRVIKKLGKKVNKKGQYRVIVQYQGTKKYAKSKAVKKFRLK